MIINLDKLFIFSIDKILSIRDFLSFLSDTITQSIERTDLKHTFPNTVIGNEFDRQVTEYLSANQDKIGELNVSHLQEVIDTISGKIRSLRYRELNSSTIPEIIKSIEELSELLADEYLVEKEDLIKINTEVKSCRVTDEISSYELANTNFSLVNSIIELLSPDGSTQINTKLFKVFVDRFTLADGVISIPDEVILQHGTSSSSITESLAGSGSADGAEEVEDTSPSITSIYEYINDDRILTSSNKFRSKAIDLSSSLEPLNHERSHENIKAFFSFYSSIKEIAQTPPITSAAEYDSFIALYKEIKLRIEAEIESSECSPEFKLQISKLFLKLNSVFDHQILKMGEEFSLCIANAQLTQFYSTWVTLSTVNTTTPMQRVSAYINEEIHKRASHIKDTLSDAPDAIYGFTSRVSETLSRITTTSLIDISEFIRNKDAAIAELKEALSSLTVEESVKDRLNNFIDYIEDLEIWGLIFDNPDEPEQSTLNAHKDAYQSVINEMEIIKQEIQESRTSRPIDTDFLKSFYHTCIVGSESSSYAVQVYQQLEDSLTESTTRVDSSISIFKASLIRVERDILRAQIEESIARGPVSNIFSHPRLKNIQDALLLIDEESETDDADIIIEFWNNYIYQESEYRPVTEAFERVLELENLQQIIDNFVTNSAFRRDNFLRELMEFSSVEDTVKALNIIYDVFSGATSTPTSVHDALDSGSTSAVEILLQSLPNDSPALNFRSIDNYNLTPLLRVITCRDINQADSIKLSQCLVVNGASIESVDAHGNNSLHLASKKDNKLLFNTLKEYATPDALCQVNDRGESVKDLHPETSFLPSYVTDLEHRRIARNSFDALDADLGSPRPIGSTHHPAITVQ